MKMDNISNEKGFVLVSVMVLTLMAGTLVLTSLQDTTIQERLSGNFQKKINSRMMAEKGVFDSLREMNQTISTMDEAGDDADTILASLNGDKNSPDNDANNGDGEYQVNINTTTGSTEITISSAGALYEGQTRLQGIFEMVYASAPPSKFPFVTGITACKAINNKGSGIIDSYNSLDGNYGVGGNINNDVDITTVEGSSEIKLVGGTRVEGNVIAADALTFEGGAHITGYVETVGDITGGSGGDVDIDGDVTSLGNVAMSNGSIGGSVHAKGYVEFNNVPVTGNIISESFISLENGSVTGYLLASGNISLTNSPSVTGSVQTHRNFSNETGSVGPVTAAGDVFLKWYGGKIGGVTPQFEGEYYSGVNLETVLAYGGLGSWLPSRTEEFPVSPLDPAPTPDEVPAVNLDIIAGGDLGTSDCDPDDIESKVSDVVAGISTGRDLLVSTNGDAYQMGASSADFTTNPGNNGKSQLRYLSDKTLVADSPATTENIAQTATFFEERLSVLVYTGVSIQGPLTIAPGVDGDDEDELPDGEDVTIFVDGNFEMGSNSSLTIPANSSLTLIITGTVDIGEGASINIERDGVNDSGKPVFSIFSSYSGSDLGIYFSGGTETAYAVINAPLAQVEIAAGTSFKGSVYANSVTVSGSGGVHYDESLAGLSDEGSDGSTGTPKLVFKGWQYITDEVVNEESDDDAEEESDDGTDSTS